MRSLLTSVALTAAMASTAHVSGQASLPAAIACPGPQPLRPACGWVYAAPAMQAPARPPAARPGDSGPPDGTVTALALTAGAAAAAVTAAAMRTRRRGRTARNPDPGQAGRAAGRSRPSGTCRDSLGHQRRDRLVGRAAASAPASRQPPSARGSGQHVPVRIALGTRDGHEATADAAALGGLGLSGPGAPAVARAIVAALLTGQHGDAGIPGEIIVPAGTAARLLPGQPGHVTRPAARGIRVPPTLEAALDETETAIVSRARTAGRLGEPRPAPLVLITAPGRAAWPRLRAVTSASRHLGVAVIVLGYWPHGITCRITADGLITAVTPPQAGLAGARAHCLTPAGLAAVTAPLRDGIPGDAVSTPGTAQPSPRTAPLAGSQLPPVLPGTRNPRPPGSPAASPPTRPGPAGKAAQPSGDQPVAPGTLAEDNTGTSPRQEPVRISVLGPLQITAAGRPVGTGPRKARELLAFLTVRGDDGATGEEISEALWPGAPPRHGTRQRNTTLWKARELLRGATGLTAPMWITLTADRYRLDPSLAGTDMQEFHAALKTARTAADDQARLAGLQQAVACYRGPLADGAGYDWAEPYAETARRRALDAWARIAEILRPADPDQALTALETALTHDPYNEYTYQQIMRLQAAQDRPDAVRRTLTLLENRLGQLDAEPAASTRQLAAELLGTGKQRHGRVASEDQ